MSNDKSLPHCTSPSPLASGRRRASRVAIAIGVGVPLSVGALALTGAGASEQSTINQSGSGAPQLEQLHITLAPGAAQTFKIPGKNQPVQVQIDKYSSNGGLQTPSEVASALVNVNQNHVGMTWVNQNSDGTTGAGNSFQDSTITSITCGTSCSVASLSVSDAGNGTVMLSQNAATSSIAFDYEVDIWY